MTKNIDDLSIVRPRNIALKNHAVKHAVASELRRLTDILSVQRNPIKQFAQIDELISKYLRQNSSGSHDLFINQPNLDKLIRCTHGDVS